MSLPEGVGIASETWQVVQGARDNGPGISGQTQLVQTGGLPWRVTYEIILRNAVVPAWKTWIVRQRDGLIPVMLGPRFYRSEAEQLYAEDGGFSDTTMFSDTTGFAEDLEIPVPVALNGAHAAGVVSLSIERFMGDGDTQDGPPVVADDYSPGEYIGIGGRLYMITTVEAGSPAYRYATLGIWPPLRSALGDGAGVDDPPRTKMRLEEKGSGGVPDLVAGGATRFTISFIEYLGAREPLE